MTIRQSIGGCVLLLMFSSPALPQTPAASFDGLIAEGGLRLGETVLVTDVWGHRVEGRLAELRPGTLVLTQGTLMLEMAEANVVRVQRRDSIQNGLWLGLGAGIAAAWITPNVFCDLPDDECAAIVFSAIGLPSIAGGALAGALVDAVIKKTVFQSRGGPGSARIQVTPMLGAGRAGALATIRF